MALSGSLGDFPLEGVLRLLATTRKTGLVEIAAEAEVGVLEIMDGALIGARYGDDTGPDALAVILSMTEGAFSFRSSEVGSPNLSGSMDELLDRAGEERERMQAMRTAIPNDRMRFALSERALSGAQITIGPQHWRLLLKVDGRRDVAQLASAVGQGRTMTRRQLQDLLEAGLIDPVEVEARPEPEPAPAPAPPLARREEAATAAKDVPVAEPSPVVEPPVLREEPPVLRVEPPAPPPAAPAPAPRVEAAPPPAAAQRPPTPAPNFWEQPPAGQPPTEDLSELLQARLAALEQPGARAQPQASPQDFWNQAQAAAAAPPPPVAEPPVLRQPEPAPAPAAPPAPPPQAQQPPAPGDDRLSAIFGRPAPAEQAPPPPPQASASAAPPPPIVQPSVSHWLPPDTTAPILEVETPSASPKEDKKRGGFFGFGRKKEQVDDEPASFMPTASSAHMLGASPVGRLASLANALIGEYNSGQYGKGRVDERMNVRLRMVDEQADPLDRMLPVHDERLDVAAIDRDFRPDQAGPYLATLVRHIVEEAERVFGKDKAKKGYRAAIKNALGGDESVLREPGVAPNLPRL